MRPLILLSCTELSKDSCDPSRQRQHTLRDADTSDCRRDGLLMSYVRAVATAGGSPLLLPNTADAQAIEAAVAAAHGLLLTGGGDVAAEQYGMTRHTTMSEPDVLRDQTETLAIQVALRQARPILAICRGIQILNVVLGGTLVQDIPSSKSAHAGARAAVKHSENVMHEVAVQAGSALHQLWAQERFSVNSSHHQAIDRIAPSLKATAWADDAIIEAAESTDGAAILAVQFHPERLAHRDDAFAALFRWLVSR